jgi:hypothetical protein
MASQLFTISPSSAKAWIFGSRERTAVPTVIAKPKRLDDVAEGAGAFPPFDELSPKAKAQVLVEVAWQLRAGVPAVSHQMSVIHQRRLASVEGDLDAWLGRIAVALAPVSAKGESALPKAVAALKADKAEGLRIINQLQCNIPAWGLTRGLQTFLRGCESL